MGVDHATHAPDLREEQKMESYGSLAIDDPEELIYGNAPHPVETKSGLKIGGGTLYPELNFTLPPINVERETWPKVRRHYQEIITGAARRAAELGVPGVMFEFEALPPMTENPAWGEEVCRILLDGIAQAEQEYGLTSALRMTPNDNREMDSPPQMRHGHHYETMIETFERCAAAGADLLSIESVGGKEISDDALTMADIRQIIFALGVMGVRDMRFLWTDIVRIADQHDVQPAGDTACGFANTAMVLAEQQMIPRSFAAVVRAVSAVRSLVAYEVGAVGPGKDCGYENVILKAITGCPMSMEGKTAACAHLSPVGNVSAAAADLWSNESVQNRKLLGGMAPTCYMEQLAYDCRLMNEAASDGPQAVRQLQDWLVRSDAPRDPQAYVLAPANAIRLARSIVQAPDHYAACRAVVLETVALLREGRESGRLTVSDRDLPFLDMMHDTVAAMPEDEGTFIEQMMAELDTSKFELSGYELGDFAHPE
jgi:methanol--5-hydroxybenzimidazolylcobamide Co-methyltransferase